MDSILITAGVIMAVIAIIEIVNVFFRLPCKKSTPAYVTVLPVFERDSFFQQRLEQLALKSGGRSRLIIVDYSASDSQLGLCRQFCRDKILLKIFAIGENL